MTIIFHPDRTKEYRRLMEHLMDFTEHLGFVEVDWCSWRMADGSLFEIYPCEPPPPMDVVHTEMIANKTGEMPER